MDLETVMSIKNFPSSVYLDTIRNESHFSTVFPFTETGSDINSRADQYDLLQFTKIVDKKRTRDSEL